MASLQSTISSKFNPNFDEHRWVIQIRRTLDEELEDETEIPVCIFSVPKTLMASDPESYTPQQIAIGPHHYWRPQLYDMERYKLAAAKRAQKKIQCDKFQNLVEQLTELEQRIRACYHMFLDFNGETIALMMTIDASFLLEFLQVYAIKEGKTVTRVSSRMAHLVDYAGRKSAHNAILRDIVMLENQVPLFVLRKMLEFQASPLESADDILLSMLMGLCKELSPFKMVQEFPKINVSDCFHLLDFLYQVIVPRLPKQPSELIIEVDPDQKEKEKSSSDYQNLSYAKQFLSQIWGILSKLNKGPVSFLKKMLLSKPVKIIFKLPWTILSNLPGFSILKQPIEYLFSSQVVKDESMSENANLGLTNDANKPPLVEEITIPSVTELVNSGVRFAPSKGGIVTITFDIKGVTLYLPTISLEVNTEVIMRNLVAYEASNGSGPLVFTRYTELMNGIIDTEDDVKLLREKGIILNHLKSDGELAKLWNGMSKSIRLTKVPFIDKVIDDVNKYYNGRWKVKAVKVAKAYLLGSWPLLTLLAAILLLLLMSLQAFCSVYSCSRFFNISTA